MAWSFTGIQKKAFSLEGDQYIHLRNSKLGDGLVPHQGTHERWGDFLIRGFLRLFYKKDNTGPNYVYFEEDVTDATGTKFVHVEETAHDDGLYSGKLYVADATKTKVIKDINTWIAAIAAAMLERVSETIGDGTSTSFTITHNFGTRDVSVEVRETSGNYYSVITPVAFNEDTVIVTFANPPATNEYRVTVIG